MDDLLRSFAIKLEKHAQTKPDDFASPEAVDQLCAILRREKVPTDIAENAIATMASIVMDDAGAFVRNRGMERLADYAKGNWIRLSGETKRGIVNVIAECSTWRPGMHPDKEAIVDLVKLHHAVGHERRLWSFLGRVTEEPRIVTALVQAGEFPCILSRLNSKLLDTPHLSAKALRVIPRFVNCRRTAQMFWDGGGAILLRQVARHRVLMRIEEGVVLTAVAQLVMSHIGVSTKALEGVSSDVVGAIAMDAHAPETTFFIHNAPLVIPSLRLALATRNGFVDTYIHRLVGVLRTLTKETLKMCLDYVSDMLKFVPDATENRRSNLIRLFIEVQLQMGPLATELPLEAKAASILCRGVDTTHVAPFFVSMLRILERSAAPNVPTFRPDAFDELDGELLVHFATMTKDASRSVTYPMVLHGHVENAAFCMASVLFGESTRVPRRYRIRARIHDYLQNCVDKYARTGTDAMRRYCRDVAQRYHLTMTQNETLPLSSSNKVTCPLTLDTMYCPVVASDGHTYEMQALVTLASRSDLNSTPLKSPMTREPLETWMVYNRALVQQEQDFTKKSDPDEGSPSA